MPLGNSLPYGLRDVKLTPYLANGSLGTAVDLPVSQTLSFTEEEDFSELRGDDSLVATHGNGPSVSWDLEAGGISLEAYAVLAGGTVTTSGTTPAQIKRYNKKSTGERPYFKIEGQVISDSGGDLHCIIWKAKVNGSIEGEFTDGEFFVTSASGIGVADADGDLYDFVQNETVTAIA